MSYVYLVCVLQSVVFLITYIVMLYQLYTVNYKTFPLKSIFYQSYNPIITFNLFQILPIIIVYLAGNVSFDLSILGYFQVKNFQKVHRSTIDKLRRPIVAKGRCGLENNSVLFYFHETCFMILNRIFWNSWKNYILYYFFGDVCAFPDSYIGIPINPYTL